MKKRILVIILFVVSALSVHAQRYLGIATSNWSGTYGMYLNPANIADSRTKFAIDLMSINFGVDNNLAGINLSGAFSSIGGNSKLNETFNYGNKQQFSLMLPYAALNLPGIMVSIDHKNSIALTLRVRGINQFNNFDQRLFRTITDPNYNSGNDFDFTSANFNWTLHAWSEINLCYGRVLYEKEEHMLKVGLNLKLLGGIGYVSLKGKNLDAHFYSAADSLRANNTDLEYSSSIIDSLSELGGGVSDAFSQFFGKKGGNGFGADIGLVYEYRPDYDDYVDPVSKHVDHSSNKYKIRASVSVTDIGSINYNNTMSANITGNGSLSVGDLAKNFTNFNSFSDYAGSRGFHLDTARGSTKVYLPTALIIGVDYYIWQHFYVNGTYIANLANRQNFGNSYYNQFTLTPRFDTKFMSVGVPITYSSLTSGFKAGFGMRFGGFILGTDDVSAFFSNSAYGVNFYVGAFVPINKKYKKSNETHTESDTNKLIK